MLQLLIVFIRKQIRLNMSKLVSIQHWLFGKGGGLQIHWALGSLSTGIPMSRVTDSSSEWYHLYILTVAEKQDLAGIHDLAKINDYLRRSIPLANGQ